MNNEILRKAIKQSRYCDVRLATVVAVVTTLAGNPQFAVCNRRGGGGVSKWSHHAEERAAARLRRKGLPLELFEMYVIRFKGDGSIGISKPCEGCGRKVKGFFRVFYTKDDGEFAELY